jgi:hypothetical protein
MNVKSHSTTDTAAHPRKPERHHLLLKALLTAIVFREETASYAG